MKRRIVVIGGGGHAKVLISVLKKCSYHVVGYTDSHDRGNILGAKYLGSDGILKEIAKRKSRPEAIIGIGKVNSSVSRLKMQRDVRNLGFRVPVIYSPRAIVNEDVVLGEGTVIFDGAVVNSGTRIGDACIINTNSTVEHDCRIGDDVHVGPGAAVSGGVEIGQHCMIGVGACIRHGVTIASKVLIGAGATVTGNLEGAGTYVGTPARKVL